MSGCLLLILSGCGGGPSTGSAAAHDSALPAVSTATGADPLPAVPTTTAPSATVEPGLRLLTSRLGVEVYWHTGGDPDDVRAKADKVLDYVVGLGSNSVGLTFPFYTDGSTPTRVYTGTETPSVQTLDVVIQEAQARGLDVMLRPLLDEGNMLAVKGNWRGNIEPPNPGAWMASYQAFLAPYLALAQSDHVGHFVIGTELVSLTDHPNALWDGLMAAARTAYTGEISYADNWDAWRTATTHSPAPVTGLDAYPRLQLDDTATSAQVTDAWRQYLTSRPANVLQHTVIQEIGIPAQAGAYKTPYLWGDSTTPVDVRIQQNWFTGACQSAKSLGMKGIYFWSVDSNADPATAAKAPSGSFMGRADDAIKGCFASGWS